MVGTSHTVLFATHNEINRKKKPLNNSSDLIIINFWLLLCNNPEGNFSFDQKEEKWWRRIKGGKPIVTISYICVFFWAV